MSGYHLLKVQLSTGTAQYIPYLTLANGGILWHPLTIAMACH